MKKNKIKIILALIGFSGMSVVGCNAMQYYNNQNIFGFSNVNNFQMNKDRASLQYYFDNKSSIQNNMNILSFEDYESDFGIIDDSFIDKIVDYLLLVNFDVLIKERNLTSFFYRSEKEILKFILDNVDSMYKKYGEENNKYEDAHIGGNMLMAKIETNLKLSDMKVLADRNSNSSVANGALKYVSNFEEEMRNEGNLKLVENGMVDMRRVCRYYVIGRLITRIRSIRGSGRNIKQAELKQQTYNSDLKYKDKDVPNVKYEYYFNNAGKIENDVVVLSGFDDIPPIGSDAYEKFIDKIVDFILYAEFKLMYAPGNNSIFFTTQEKDLIIKILGDIEKIKSSIQVEPITNIIMERIEENLKLSDMKGQIRSYVDYSLIPSGQRLVEDFEKEMREIGNEYIIEDGTEEQIAASKKKVTSFYVLGRLVERIRRIKAMGSRIEENAKRARELPNQYNYNF